MSNVTYITHDGSAPPTNLKVDVRGLTPARAQLARHIAWIASVEAELATLVAGREKLADHIGRLDRVEAKHRQDKTAAAMSILDRVRSGLPFAIVAPAASENTAELPVAREALTALEAEISRVEAQLDGLRARKPRFVAAAVREAAQGLYADYATAQENLREIMTQIAGLDAALGAPRPGRLVAVLPDLAGSSGLDDLPVAAVQSEITAARKVWDTFARALAQDPRAPADMLEFQPHDPIARDDLTYDRLHPLERQIVDITFAKNGA